MSNYDLTEDICKKRPKNDSKIIQKRPKTIQNRLKSDSKMDEPIFIY